MNGWSEGFGRFRLDVEIRLGAPDDTISQKWSDAANLLFGEGCEPQSLMLLSSFAAPLMALHLGAPRSALVTWAGKHPGAGRSTAIMAAATVWGDPTVLTVPLSSRGPDRDLDIRRIGNLPPIFERLDALDPAIRADVLRRFIDCENGRPTIGLATVPEHTSTRIYDRGFVIDLEGRIPKHLIDDSGRLQHELMRHRGAAGLRFLEFVTGDKNVKWLSAHLRALLNETISRSRHGNKAPFPVWSYWWVAVVAAAEIVLRLKLLEFDLKRIREAAMAALDLELP